MAVITLANFAGSAQAVNPRLLPESVGVLAEDCRPGFSDLRPLCEPTHAATLDVDEQQYSIYRFGRDDTSDSQFWLSWPERVSAVRGQDGSENERVYFTQGAGVPAWLDASLLATGPLYPPAPVNGEPRPLAIRAPVRAITVTVGTEPADGTQSYVGYVYTWVNDVGWESAPSPLSELVLAKAGATIYLDNMESPDYANTYRVSKIRIYRTQADGQDAANYFFLREINVPAMSPPLSSVDDGRALGELMATTGWRPPPAGVKSLCGMWNGMMAAISKRTIIFCEPYVPYAWPARYDIQSTDKPVALAAWQQNLLVLTTGAPMLITGSSPDSLDQSVFAVSVPCVSARGVVAFGHGACWPSPDGLAYSGALPDAIITRGIFTERQWRELDPSSMVAARWGRFYACSFGPSLSRRGFLIDPTRPADGVWWLSFGWNAAWYDELQDILYILQGNEILRFDGDDLAQNLTATFESKHFVQQEPKNYGWAKVVADGYPVRLTIYSDDQRGKLHKRMVRDVLNSRPFTLPSGFRSEVWQFKVESCHDVQAVRIANNASELSQ